MTEDEMNGTPPQTAVSVVRSGRLGDVLIRLREALLDRLAGVNAALVVNTVVDQSAPPPSFDLAAQIKNVLTDLKGKAMDAGGDRVAYAALRRDPAYAAYRQTYHPALRRFDPASLSPAAARAFWINLYNALVIDAVLAFNVQTSVVEGFTGLLTFFRRAAYVVGGQRVSLEDMEHGILRGNRGNPYAPGAHFATADPRLAWALPVDPRLHFALNCGGRSCPPIRVYTPDRLDQQLDLAAKGYLETAVVLRADGALVLPQILRWFAADFGGQAGVLRFLEAYLPDADRRRLLSSNAPRIAYAPYDWRLNVL